MGNTLDAPKSVLDNTVKIFDSYYNSDIVIDANQYEIVKSYFFDVSKSENISSNFASMIFRISNITGDNPLDLIEYMKGNAKTKIEANATMIFYLNAIKSKTALYGISVVPQPNDNVQRNVLI
jgi:hypothetical protein